MIEIQKDVEELLLSVVDYKTTDWDQFIEVRDKLVKMIIVSVAPPIMSATKPEDVFRESDFSRKKESFIAP